MASVLHHSLHAFVFAVSLVVLLFTASALAYIPAQATNDTIVAENASTNLTDGSRVKLQWYPGGSYEGRVARVLAGSDSSSSGVSKGAFVHFSEDGLRARGTSLTTTPWIALISCDKNSTNASQEDDIFTLARNRGAVAALLYSLNATTCFVNPEYSDPAQYDQVTDVFVTLSLPSSELIEGQFTTVLGNASRYYDFNPVLLNDSQSQIVYSIVNGTVPGAGYLFATLTSNINGTETSNPPTATPFNGDTSIEASMIQVFLCGLVACVAMLV